MAEDFTGKIKDWINNQGYPFEIFVAKAFKEAGFIIGQSLYYTDETTGSAREVDVIAYRTKLIGETSYSFAFVIECKSSKGKPWIAFKTDSSIKGSLKITSRDATIRGKHFLKAIAKQEKENTDSLFNFDDELSCYNLTQAFTNGNEVPFTAIANLGKAISSFIKKFETHKSDFNIYASKNAFIYFPIVAIESMLYSFELDDDGSDKIKDIQNIKYISRRQEDNHTYFIVDIVTKEIIHSYAKKLHNYVMNLFKLYDAEMVEIDEKAILRPRP
ncbi:hypothetical protein ACTHGU_21460 [Chitinophagaceae bacterium MMS25-I14]